MKVIKNRLLLLADSVLFILVYPAALLLKRIRIIGVHRLPISKRMLMTVGVFPIRDHYYEPLFHERHLTKPLSAERHLPGINWNIFGQLAFLEKLKYSCELADILGHKSNNPAFSFDNDSFKSGDAEYLYNVIRLNKPKRIFEIGSGNSTLIAIRGVEKNKLDDPGYSCRHVCIEPYEMPWLENTGVEVKRERIEDAGLAFFTELEENDLLFIDSSHIIRPQGDVLFEYLELLPTLKKGVLVHIHDIFSPRDYLDQWIKENVWFWNEQYLLEAFLTSNREWEIVGAINHLYHNHYDALKKVCPYLTPYREPGSFYLRKIA
jgi:predicted O-methyltransferase YrrM